MHLENDNIRDLTVLQVRVTVMASYDIISLIKEETYTQLLLSSLHVAHGSPVSRGREAISATDLKVDVIQE